MTSPRASLSSRRDVGESTALRLRGKPRKRYGAFTPRVASALRLLNGYAHVPWSPPMRITTLRPSNHWQHRMQRILILDAHPDANPARYLHALVASYADAARQSGHDVAVINLSALDFPLLRSAADYAQPQAPAALREVQERIRWCTHWVIFYPLWM